MKRIAFYLFCCLSAVLFVACGPQEPAKVSVTGIVLDRVKATLTEGETTTLVPTITPADATDKSVTWSSSNQAVATVTDGGVVSALHAGTSVITAKTNDGGMTASCTVTVDIAMAALTGDASHISCRNAEISGKANLPANTSTDLKIGVLYATGSGVIYGSSTAIEATTFDSDFNYTITTETLEPETTYYYRCYILQNNEVTYGDTKSFTTLPVSSMIKTEDATDVEATVATLHAALDLTDCKYDSVEYGFQLSQEGGTASSLKAANLSNKVYSVRAEGLSREKNYEVVAYVTLDGRMYTADRKTFSTQTIQASVTLNDATDITELKATISGKLNVESQGSFTKTATLYYSSISTTAEDLKAQGTAISLTLNNADGTFSKQLADLVPGTAYRYVVIAAVDGVAFTSDVKSFTTANFFVTVTTGTASNVECATALLNGTLSVSSIESLNKEVWFLYSETATTGDALIMSGIKVSATLSDETFSALLSGIKDATTYYYVACAIVHDRLLYGNVTTFTTKKCPVAVDMGLSVKWASLNVGAEKPESYGDYYAWGEIETKSNYSWSTYKFGASSSGPFSKYNTSSYYGTLDRKTRLDPEDDVAQVRYGGKWRMPTDAEWTELMNTDNCTWTWTTQNGVNGRLVTSKKTGNSIFLPAAGWRENDDLKLGYMGPYGYYWSSSLSVYPGGAWYVYFNSGNVLSNGENRDGRYYGRSVRAICED